MTAIPSAPVDAETASLLALVKADPIHERDVATVCEAIRSAARVNGGVLDPNELRMWLRNEHGCVVYPNVIGATVHTLAIKGALTFSHWVVTTGSTSGNNGRPARAYRLTP